MSGADGNRDVGHYESNTATDKFFSFFGSKKVDGTHKVCGYPGKADMVTVIAT